MGKGRGVTPRLPVDLCDPIDSSNRVSVAIPLMLRLLPIVVFGLFLNLAVLQGRY
jgi:hypothetical protein